MCITSPWLLNVYMDKVMGVKMGIGRIKVQFSEDGEKWRLPRMETDERGKL